MTINYRRLGRSGLKVSELSFGSWVTFGTQIDRKKAVDCMGMAYEAGVNFFDNAEVYAQGESEIIMGKALNELNWDRSSYIVSSKVFWGGEKPTQRGLSRKHVHDACHDALKRLQVDYLDLFFCHRPDPETPIEETVHAMDILVKQGKVLYWGTSEWSATDIMEAYKIADKSGLTPPSMEQPQYNMFHRERVEKEYRKLYEKYGMGTTIWSPLASGLLTGKYLKEIPKGSRMTLKGYEWLKERLLSDLGQEHQKKVQALTYIAEETGYSMAQLAIAWCLKQPVVSTVILGASSSEQLAECLKASELTPLLNDDLSGQIESVLGSSDSE